MLEGVSLAFKNSDAWYIKTSNGAMTDVEGNHTECGIFPLLLLDQVVCAAPALLQTTKRS